VNETALIDERVGSSVLPLAVGNEWRYERERYVRGGFVERDTVVVTVKDVSNSYGYSLYEVELNEPYQLRSYYISPVSDEQIDVVPNPLVDSSLEPFITFNPLLVSTGILPIVGSGSSNTTAYSLGEDTTYNEYKARRIIQKAEFIDGFGTIVLRMRFEHIFVLGIGLVVVKFISDINECLVCKLHSEFMTYKLISHKLR
jgi:hypothetical protein